MIKSNERVTECKEWAIIFQKFLFFSNSKSHILNSSQKHRATLKSHSYIRSFYILLNLFFFC